MVGVSSKGEGWAARGDPHRPVSRPFVGIERKSDRDWTVDRSVEVVVLPNDLACCVAEGSFPVGFYPRT